MTKPHNEHRQSTDDEDTGTDGGRRIEGAADEIFWRASDAVEDVAERATHLARDTLDRGRAGIRRAERSSRGGHPGRGERGLTSPLATALAVGAMGYAIATLIQGAMSKRHAALHRASPETPPA
ncbi:hypothetical protein MKK70_09400 [Methylobacterium sp. E-041]|uniref:hypothetical protein n=1 Tax=Methylobacterium sp. E-041 TaxID=2836573 RepID=UPI001FB90F3F|nr:hypothetical protein [Methylobacterium sp. E-041]MCJ2105589.1 hypothetical protein [Methylobacterium sp. E-041]